MTCAGIMFSPPARTSTCFSAYASSVHGPEASLFLHAAKKFGLPKMHEPDFPSPGPSPAVTTATKDPPCSATPTPINGTSSGKGGVDLGTHATDAHYISANCVLFTYYSGDISSVVDEHFSRALSQPAGYNTPDADKGNVSKDSSPMSQRNFPPSFWNSNYQSSSGIPGTLTHHAELAYSCDPYHAAAASAGAAALHGLHHQGDPWHYSLSAQPPYSHRQMHDLATAYSASMPATTRFNPQYSSLILQPSVRPSRLPPVPGQCPPLGKADAWAAATAPRYHEPLGPAELAHLDSNYGAGGGHSYPTMGNMAVTTMTADKNSELWHSARRQPRWQ